MSKKIYVGSISDTTTNENLSKHFSQKGTVISANITQKVTFDKNSRSGYVVMKTDQETKTAITELHNSLLDGSKLRVLEAHSLDQERAYKPTYKRKY